MSNGCLMIDILGLEISMEEIEQLNHPLTGGVILFSRNFESQSQLESLCQHIRKSTQKQILIAVDQEGGRVQRFHNEFSKLPAMGSFKNLDLPDNERLKVIKDIGWLMAAELISSGIDISFAPVLDLDIDLSTVIGDRGFSGDPQQIIEYSSALMQGMHEAGMKATGKHFPGHGSTKADSHFENPVDHRCFEEIQSRDMLVFKKLIENGLSGIMPAHVLYPEVDSKPACFSHYWLEVVLRTQLGFRGVVFSDDLSMQGAKAMGDIRSRAEEALAVGCDMILCCNDPSALTELLDTLPQKKFNDKNHRLQSMIHSKTYPSFSSLKNSPRWQRANQLTTFS